LVQAGKKAPESIEIKGAGLKRGKNKTFAFKGICLHRTDLKHLFLLSGEGIRARRLGFRQRF